MSQGEKLSAIYSICKNVKDGDFLEESVIDAILSIVTFDKHDFIETEESE